MSLHAVNVEHTFVDKCSVIFTSLSAPTNVTCSSLFFIICVWKQLIICCHKCNSAAVYRLSKW